MRRDGYTYQINYIILYYVILTYTALTLYFAINRYKLVYIMDPIKNPFSPGAGSPPPELAGRSEIIHQSKILLGRVKEGRPEKSFLLIGLLFNA